MGGGVLLFSLSNYLKHIATYNVYSKSEFILCVFCLVFFFFFYITFYKSLAGKLGSPYLANLTQVPLPGSPYLAKATTATTAALPIPITSISVCSNFFCPNNALAASVWKFSVRTDADASDRTRGLYEHR